MTTSLSSESAAPAPASPPAPAQKSPGGSSITGEFRNRVSVEPTPEPTPQGTHHSESAILTGGAADWQASAFGLERGDRRFMTVVSVVALVLMTAHWYRITRWEPTPLTVQRPAGAAYQFTLDLNTASWVEWMQLEGIGETLARRIVADREQHGPFANVEALQRVPGIGPKTLERIRRYIANPGQPVTAESKTADRK